MKVNSQETIFLIFQVETAIIQEISFRKPKRGNFHLQLQAIVVNLQPVQFADTTSFLENL